VRDGICEWRLNSAISSLVLAHHLAKRDATALVHELVMTAKTEALLMMGERRRAFELMDESLNLV
jgi:hypothetical protein